MTEGEWFESRLMKSGSSLGFLYSLYVPFVKSNVKPKKLVVTVVGLIVQLFQV